MWPGRLIARLAVSAILAAASGAHAQVIDGSLAAELGIDGASVSGTFSGTAGVGIPLPSVALGIAPGEPVLIVNSDLNVVAIVGGAIENATGGVIPDGAAQSVIRAGLSGGDVVQVIETQAVNVVAAAVEEQSGGFVPASASRAVLSTAINGGDVGDAIVRVAFDRVVQEATKLLAGQVGSAVQNATGGFVDSATVEALFNGVARGRNLRAVFEGALRQRIGGLGQNGGATNPVVIINSALAAP